MLPPDSAVSKGIRHPHKALSWILRNTRQFVRENYDEYVFTPLRSMFLFEEEWDIAIILDGCRYDIAKERVPSHSADLGEPRPVLSAGSRSPEWIGRTFSSAADEILTQTAYITGNVFTDQVPKSVVGHVDAVWRYAWDKELETVPPGPITDRAIHLIRKGTFDRYLIHYMQPHLPPVGDMADEFPGFQPHEGFPGQGRDDPDEWAPVHEGLIEPEVAREAYRENLDPVLDELEKLLNNVDADKVIVTADHGNYLGENGQWGHPKGHTHPAVRRVPWWETSATNNHTYTPKEYDTTFDKTQREEKLRALGYR